MLTSVFTPTHNPTWLDRAYQSLRRQTNKQFEWILVPNGDCDTLPQDIVADDRVRVFPAPQFTDQIGALKRYAVQHCRGDLLVEFDHDDELAPKALATLASNADTAKPQMLYSDFAVVQADHTPHVFGAQYGWETYDWWHDGRQLKAHRAFETEPVALSWLQFSPNHVRAWTRAGYDLAGGFPEKLALADDYDLLLRSYLAGLDFRLIPDCLYVQYEHESTSKTENAKLQTAHQNVANEYIDRVVDEWCRREQLPTIELGISTKQDTAHQLLLPLSHVTPRTKSMHPYNFPGLSELPTASVGQLYCKHLLPFLSRQLVLPFFEECYRVLAPRGWFRCLFPTTDGRAAFTNPLYQTYWNQCSLQMLTRRQQAEMAGGHNCRFYQARAWDTWLKPEDRFDRMFHSRVDLVALKGQRQPGWVDI